MSAMFRRAGLALVTAVALITSQTVPASAADVAPDADTAVRQIVFPVAGPSSYTDTFGACRSGCSRPHEGIDIMAPKLTKLVAARDATVTWLKDTATPDGSQGNYLTLRDSDGWEYWYIHINNDTPGTDDGANPPEWIFGPGITKGAEVSAGQLVGYVGDSGNAEDAGSHLHFEIHEPDGSVIDPFESLDQATKLASAVDPAALQSDDADYVRELTTDFLDRDATDAETAAGVSRLADGASRESVVLDYANSDEWVTVLITQYYESTLGRAPDPAGLQNWIDAIGAGMTPADVAAQFYASREYFLRSGGTNQDWITDLYREILRRDPESAGLENWVRAADTGRARPDIAADFYGSMESRATRVTALYQTLLGRSPDRSGLATWTEVLRNGRDIDLAAMLASSPEYYQRAVRRAT